MLDGVESYRKRGRIVVNHCQLLMVGGGGGRAWRGPSIKDDEDRMTTGVGEVEYEPRKGVMNDRMVERVYYKSEAAEVVEQRKIGK